MYLLLLWWPPAFCLSLLSFWKRPLSHSPLRGPDVRAAEAATTDQQLPDGRSQHPLPHSVVQSSLQGEKVSLPCASVLGMFTYLRMRDCLEAPADLLWAHFSCMTQVITYGCLAGAKGLINAVWIQSLGVFTPLNQMSEESLLSKLEENASCFNIHEQHCHLIFTEQRRKLNQEIYSWLKERWEEID